MTEDPACIAAIRVIALRAGLNEAVGLLYRAPGEPELVVELVNRSEQPQNSYAVSTADIATALSRCSVMSIGDVGGIDPAHFVVWHSHPSGARGPSLKDMRTKLPGLTYAVVVIDGDRLDMIEY